MTLTVLKRNFHSLIEKVENKELLVQFYKAFSYSAKKKEGLLFNSLNSDEKKTLLKSYKESKDRKNLISHETVMKKYSKWLTK